MERVLHRVWRPALTSSDPLARTSHGRSPGARPQELLRILRCEDGHGEGMAVTEDDVIPLSIATTAG